MLAGCERMGRGSPVVYEERDDLDHLLWMEEWTDRSKLEKHLETDVFKTLIGALRTLATVEDCRIVDLRSAQRSGRLPSYEPCQVEGQRISHGAGAQRQAENPPESLGA
jgi:hypothetical protein